VAQSTRQILLPRTWSWVQSAVQINHLDRSVERMPKPIEQNGVRLYRSCGAVGVEIAQCEAKWRNRDGDNTYRDVVKYMQTNSRDLDNFGRHSGLQSGHGV
jgi:hypothetical protein